MHSHSRQMPYSPEKAVRLEARLSPEQKKLIQYAADLAGRSLTDFVISSSQKAANKVIREHEIITLTTKDSRRFVDALFDHPEPNAALKKAAKRHDEFIKKKG